MMSSRATIRLLPAVLRRAQHTASATTFFLFGLWLRPAGLPTFPYYAGFISAAAVLIALAAWLLRGAPGYRAACRDERRFLLIGLYLLAFWILISPSWATYRPLAIEWAQQWLAVILFAVLMLADRPALRVVAGMCAAGLMVQAIVIIAQIGVQGAVGLRSLGELPLNSSMRVSIVADGSNRLLRGYGLNAHPNMVAGYLVAALLALIGWLTPGTDGTRLAAWRGAVRLIAVALGVYGLCLTFSRAAWGAALGGLVIAAILSRRLPRVCRPSWQRLTLAALACAVPIGLFLLGYGKYVVARTGVGGDTTEQISVAERRVFIEVALQIIRQNPLTGTGIGTFAWEARDVLAQSPLRGQVRPQNVHNLALLALSELGLIGFALWAGIQVVGAALIWRRIRDPFAVGLAAAWAALLAIGLLDHYLWGIFPFAALLWGSLGGAVEPDSAAR